MEKINIFGTYFNLIYFYKVNEDRITFMEFGVPKPVKNIYWKILQMVEEFAKKK